MSRAFVKEDDSGKDDGHINPPTEPFFATPAGIVQWQLRLDEIGNLQSALKGELSPAQTLESHRFAREAAVLTARLQLAKPATPPPPGQVGFGSRVVLEDEEGTTWTFHLVSGEETDPAAGAISCHSPLGRQLMGRGIDDTIQWIRQGKSHTMTIVSL